MENVCRTCLRISSELTPLYSDETLVSKIEKLASIKLNMSPDFPSNVCRECVNNVNKLFNFRKVIINSEKELTECKVTMERTRLVQANNNSVKKEEAESESNNAVIMEEMSPDEYANDSDSELNIPDADFKEFLKKRITKLYTCKICDTTFPSRIKLYNHRRTEHVMPGVCSICGITVRSDNLRRHIQMHSEGPAACQHCGKVFKNSESLRGHLYIHRGIVFTCEICGKQSKIKAEHSRHMKTHIDPELRKAMCTICGKKVRDIRKHTYVHTGERPHLCTYCSKGFTSRNALKVHTRQHTNERPYTCGLCPCAFPQKVSLVTHMKSKHSTLT